MNMTLQYHCAFRAFFCFNDDMTVLNNVPTPWLAYASSSDDNGLDVIRGAGSMIDRNLENYDSNSDGSINSKSYQLMMGIFKVPCLFFSMAISILDSSISSASC